MPSNQQKRLKTFSRNFLTPTRIHTNNQPLSTLKNIELQMKYKQLAEKLNALKPNLEQLKQSSWAKQLLKLIERNQQAVPVAQEDPTRDARTNFQQHVNESAQIGSRIYAMSLYVPGLEDSLKVTTAKKTEEEEVAFDAFKDRVSDLLKKIKTAQEEIEPPFGTKKPETEHKSEE